jgi:AcrR family transcriptional regulator
MESTRVEVALEAAVEEGDYQPALSSQDAHSPVQAIMRSAAQLFTETGYHATSMEDVAELAGVTKGALFYHVRTKQDLLIRIQRSVLERGGGLLRTASEARGSNAEVLARMVHTYLRLLGAYHNEIAVVNESTKFLPGSSFAEMSSFQDQWYTYFRTVVERGVRAREFGVQDIDLTALLIFGMLNSSYRWYRPDGPIGEKDIARIYSTLLLLGMRGRRQD